MSAAGFSGFPGGNDTGLKLMRPAVRHIACVATSTDSSADY